VVTKGEPLIAVAHGYSEEEVFKDWQTLSEALFPKIYQPPSFNSLEI